MESGTEIYYIHEIEGNGHDYRYFPDPDLMPVKIDSNWIDQIKKNF